MHASFANPISESDTDDSGNHELPPSQLRRSGLGLAFSARNTPRPTTFSTREREEEENDDPHGSTLSQNGIEREEEWKPVRQRTSSSSQSRASKRKGTGRLRETSPPDVATNPCSVCSSVFGLFVFLVALAVLVVFLVIALRGTRFGGDGTVVSMSVDTKDPLHRAVFEVAWDAVREDHEKVTRENLTSYWRLLSFSRLDESVFRVEMLWRRKSRGFRKRSTVRFDVHLAPLSSPVQESPHTEMSTMSNHESSRPCSDAALHDNPLTNLVGFSSAVESTPQPLYKPECYVQHYPGTLQTSSKSNFFSSSASRHSLVAPHLNCTLRASYFITRDSERGRRSARSRLYSRRHRHR